MQTKINATIVAHSVNPEGDELISVLATFPRIILAEVNTHRMLSKNTSSSRAIPFNKMVETIKNDPFIPIAWQEDHKGMQGVKYLETGFSMQAQQEWLIARDYAISIATQMNSSTYVTKQLCNRLLEPFMWTTMLITGPKSGWDNFFHLRCPQYVLGNGETFKSWKDVLAQYDFEKETIEEPYSFKAMHNKGQAEIHMMALAECIWDAYNESTPKKLQAGDWHIPFEDKILEDSCIVDDIEVMKISVAMAARTSYTIVGEEKALDYETLIGLYDRLLAQTPPHSSPLEHCAKCMSEAERQMYRKVEKTKSDSEGLGWCNNFKGFIPYRYLVDNGLDM